MDAALTANDLTTLYRIVHTLKGSALSIGLRRLARASKCLLTALTSSPVERLEELVRIIHQEASVGISALRVELGPLRDAPG